MKRNADIYPPQADRTFYEAVKVVLRTSRSFNPFAKEDTHGRKKGSNHSGLGGARTLTQYEWLGKITVYYRRPKQNRCLLENDAKSSCDEQMILLKRPTAVLQQRLVFSVSVKAPCSAFLRTSRLASWF